MDDLTFREALDASCEEALTPSASEPTPAARPVFLTLEQMTQICADLEEAYTAGDYSDVDAPEPEPEAPSAPGFETLTSKEQIKRFLDLIGIGPHHSFPVAIKATIDGKEQWRHFHATRMGGSGDAVLYDYVETKLRNGEYRKPTDYMRGELSIATAGDLRQAFRGLNAKDPHIFIRPQIFPTDDKFHITRIEENCGIERRVFFVEGDGDSIEDQQRRIARLTEKGLKPNAVVFSGSKSLHVYYRKPRSWDTTPEQDDCIDRMLCLLLNGDTQAQTKRQAARMPGCDRPGAGPQRLVDGTDAPMPDYITTLGLLTDLVTEDGIEEVDVAYEERKAQQMKRAERKAVDRHRGSGIGQEWAAWEAAGGWPEAQRTAAAAFGGVGLKGADSLLDLMSKNAADLVREGSEPGTRHDGGLRLTLELRGVVDLLDDLGLKGVQEQAQGVLERWVEASNALGGEDVDEARLQDQYERAAGALPGRPVAGFMNSLHFLTDGQLGERKENTGTWLEDDIGENAESKNSLSSFIYDLENGREKCFSKILGRTLEALENGSEDLYMLLTAALKSRFRLTDDQIAARLLKLYLNNKLGSDAKRKESSDGVNLAKIEKLKYLQDGFSIAGVKLTYGKMYTGKTMFAIYTAYNHVQGKNVFDREQPCTPGKALIIATDSGVAALANTMENIGISVGHVDEVTGEVIDADPLLEGPNKRIWIWGHDEVSGEKAWLADFEGLIKLEKFVRDNGITYVVIDSAKATTSGVFSYTNNEAVKQLMRFCTECICTPYQCCIDWITHDGTEKGTQAGAKAWVEDISMSIRLTSVEDENGNKKGVKAEFVKDRASPLHETRSFTYTLIDGTLQLSEGQEVVGTCEDKILQLLDDRDRPMTVGDLKETLLATFGTAPKTVENTVSKLMTARKIVRRGRGRYALSPGEEARRRCRAVEELAKGVSEWGQGAAGGGKGQLLTQVGEQFEAVSLKGVSTLRGGEGSNPLQEKRSDNLPANPPRGDSGGLGGVTEIASEDEAESDPSTSPHLPVPAESSDPHPAAPESGFVSPQTPQPPDPKRGVGGCQTHYAAVDLPLPPSLERSSNTRARENPPAPAPHPQRRIVKLEVDPENDDDVFWSQPRFA